MNIVFAVKGGDFLLKKNIHSTYMDSMTSVFNTKLTFTFVFSSKFLHFVGKDIDCHTHSGKVILKFFLSKYRSEYFFGNHFIQVENINEFKN